MIDKYDALCSYASTSGIDVVGLGITESIHPDKIWKEDSIRQSNKLARIASANAYKLMSQSNSNSPNPSPGKDGNPSSPLHSDPGGYADPIDDTGDYSGAQEEGEGQWQEQEQGQSAYNAHAEEEVHVDEDYERKYNLLHEVLESKFIFMDMDMGEEITAADFWGWLKALNAGYTDEDLYGMAEWTGWETDGMVVYMEVLAEVTDNVLRTLEYGGVSVDDKVAEMWQQHEDLAAALWNDMEAAPISAEDGGEAFQGMCPDLRSHLKASFNAYDVNDNGVLDEDEFFHAITGILRFGSGDIEKLRVSLLNN
jgi:hypothetical protein